MPTQKLISTKSELETSVQFLKSIGPVRAKILEEAFGIRTIRDFLYFFPYRHIDRSTTIRVRDLFRWNEPEPKSVTIVGTVEDFYYTSTRNPKARAVPFSLVLADETGKFGFTFWRPQAFVEDYWMKRFTRDESIALSATFEKRNGQLKYSNVEYDKLSEDGMQFHTGGIVPLYSSSQKLQEKGLWSSSIRVLMHSALPHFIEFLEEMFPEEMLKRYNLFMLRDAIHEYHFPNSLPNIQKARKRLAFEELFFFQLLLSFRRKNIERTTKGISFSVAKGGLPRQLLDSLSFQLTASQEKVLKEIVHDMQSPKAMNRLLQGDVGSGKTIVALLSILVAVENGYQCAFMAPTEILAEQHVQTLKLLLKDLPVKISLLVGRQRVKVRRETLAEIQNGTVNIIVGTHALIQDKVEFYKLGFIVIDEQHRFGVMQRGALREKVFANASPDVLLMTATPIPRTLSMTLYGDMDISTITELPKNRKAIITKIVPRGKSNELKEFILKQIGQGRQIYIVYPLIEESEKLDLKAAEEGFEILCTKTFPNLRNRIGLVHGRLKSDEKETVMKKFIARELDILVSTTVIEVGIDVPNASVMVIVNAERFGLSQLHQLRGRVGRGVEQSYCFLQTNNERNERLATLTQTTDGFVIAEADLQQRGPGDYFGTRQSGLPEFKHVNFWEDKELFAAARTEAETIAQNDPYLRSPKHQKLREEFERKYKAMLDIASG